MSNSKKIFAGLLCLVVSAFTFVSCDKEDPAPLNATVDVFVQDIKTDDGVKYSLVVYATANYEIKSAKVTGPGTDGVVYTLKASSDKRQFVLIPGSDDYTSEMPVKGDYTFEIIAENSEKVVGKDVVGEEKLAAIVIKTTTFSEKLLKTTWDKIEKTDGYAVRLYSADKSTLLFSSPLIAADKAELSFGATTTGWFGGKSPVAETSYVVELLGVKFETGSTYDQGNNIQFITLDSKTVVWK